MKKGLRHRITALLVIMMLALPLFVNPPMSRAEAAEEAEVQEEAEAAEDAETANAEAANAEQTEGADAANAEQTEEADAVNAEQTEEADAANAEQAERADVANAENSEDAEAPEEEGSDLDLLTPAEGTVRILTSVTGGKDEEEMELFAKELGEKTGLDIVMEKPASDYQRILLQKLGAGEAYDLIYFNQPSLYDFVDQGTLTNLTERIQNSKILADPEVVPQSEWDAIAIDGEYYASFNKLEILRLPNVNRAMAKEAGLDVDAIEPTLEGYYDYMKQMKEYYGEDFYGLSLVLKDAWDMQPWFSSVGVKTGLVENEDGTLSVPIASEDAVPVWEWLRQLYEEGLLDPDSVTDGSGEMRSKFQNGQTAVVTDWAAWTGLYNANAGEAFPNEFEAVSLPGTKTPDGSYMLARGDASLWGIPVNSENPDGAFRVMEFFATKEGSMLLSFGVEGHDYEVEDDGSVRLTDVGLSHGMDHGAPVVINQKFEPPVPVNEEYTNIRPYVDHGLEYIEYASLEANNIYTDSYKEIAGKYAIQIVTGEVSVEDGLAAMNDEFREAEIFE